MKVVHCFIASAALSLCGSANAAPAYEDEVKWDAATAQVDRQCKGFNHNYGLDVSCSVDKKAFAQYRPVPEYFKALSKKQGDAVSPMYYPAQTCTTNFMEKTVANTSGLGGAEQCANPLTRENCQGSLKKKIKALVCSFSDKATSIIYDPKTMTAILSAGRDLDEGNFDLTKINLDWAQKTFPEIHAGR